MKRRKFLVGLSSSLIGMTAGCNALGMNNLSAVPVRVIQIANITQEETDARIKISRGDETVYDEVKKADAIDGNVIGEILIQPDIDRISEYDFYVEIKGIETLELSGEKIRRSYDGNLNEKSCVDLTFLVEKPWSRNSDRETPVEKPSNVVYSHKFYQECPELNLYGSRDTNTTTP